MERPKGKRQPIERQVTAEMMYLHDRWRNGQLADGYEALSQDAQRMYQEDAETLAVLGGGAVLLELFEKYDGNRSELSHSCEALANELLKYSGSYSDGMNENFEPTQLPGEVLTKIRALRVGGLLAEDNEQLARSLDPERESTLDVRKADATLTDIYLRVSKYRRDRKYAVTSEPGIKPQFPRDYLVYPSDEVSYCYCMELTFEYYHPEVGTILETLELNVSGRGELGVQRDIYISGFGGPASEGMYVKVLDNPTEQDIADFADIIAEVSGDEPTPTHSHNDYDDVKTYIRRIPNSLSRAYVAEWLDNTSRSYVRMQLSTPTPENSTLHDALLDPNDTSAHDALVTLVNYDRAFYNDRAQSVGADNHEVRPWRDRIER